MLFPTQTNLLKCPILEKCILDNHNKYNLIFDFPSFIKLKELKCTNEDFLYLNQTLLSSATLYPHFDDNDTPYEIEKELLEKILTIKTLKEIDLELYQMTNDILIQIKGENLSVEKMYINWKNYDCNLYNLQNKFPNLSYLYLYFNSNNNYDYLSTLEIKEN